MIRKFNFLLAFAFLCFASFAQKIENISFSQEGKKISIYYDIAGALEGQTFSVSSYCSTDGGISWGAPLKMISGDTGMSVLPGKGKKIVWDVLAERENLVGTNIVFEVRAIANSSPSSTTVVVKSNQENDIKGSISDNKIEMIFVKGGTFNMGCTDEQGRDCEDNEKPVHSVTVSSFYIGKYEVNQRQWMSLMETNPSKFDECDSCPVDRVSWLDIQDFITKLNAKTGKIYRLPTEAEWEFAARGGTLSDTAFKYSGSNILDEVGWFTDNANRLTRSGGQKKANKLGIYDMSGNVWEWCSDWYAPEYYSGSPQSNPTGPTTGESRAIRGGGWDDHQEDCRVSYRLYDSPDHNDGYTGFRLVLVP